MLQKQGHKRDREQDGVVVWSEWSVGGSCLCVYGKHPGCSWQNREADGSQGETYQCVEWHPEIITSNQSSAGSADRLRLMAPDFCLTALNKWGDENRATEQQNQCPLHFSPIERKMPSLFLFQCAPLCVSVCVCCCSSLCAHAVQFVYVEKLGGMQARTQGGKVTGRESFTNGLLFSQYCWVLCCKYTDCGYSAVQCKAERNKLLFKEALLGSIF